MNAGSLFILRDTPMYIDKFTHILVSDDNGVRQIKYQPRLYSCGREQSQRIFTTQLYGWNI